MVPAITVFCISRKKILEMGFQSFKCERNLDTKRKTLFGSLVPVVIDVQDYENKISRRISQWSKNRNLTFSGVMNHGI